MYGYYFLESEFHGGRGDYIKRRNKREKRKKLRSTIFGCHGFFYAHENYFDIF